MEPKEEKSPMSSNTPKHQPSSVESLGSNEDPYLPTPGSSSTLIASWRQREVSNFTKPHSASKKGSIVSLPNVNSLQSKTFDYDSISACESTQSSLTVPPLTKTNKKTSIPSVNSSQDVPQEILSTLMNEMELQVDARLTQLETEMAKEFKDKMNKMEERMTKKWKVCFIP